METLEIGKIYKMSGVDVVCVGFTKKGYAIMQTIGMTSGRWPGEGDISDYNDVTRKFTSEWEGVIKKFKLPTKEQIKKNEEIRTALTKAACNYNSFGAGGYGAWIGTPYGSGGAYSVRSNGNVGYGGTSVSFVCAPLFNLDESKIILEGDEIKKTGVDLSWAKDMQTSDEMINEAIKAFHEDDCSVVCQVADEIQSDGDDDTAKLLQMYKYASEDQKAVIDATLVHLTGWSLRSLLERMGIKQREVNDNLAGIGLH